MIAMFAYTAALAATPAPSESTGDQAIVVTGQKDTRKTVRQFVRSLTPTLFSGQITRFEHSVCPAVYGLEKPQSEAVAKRMRQVAQSVGIVVEREPCAANVVLIVTADKRVFLKEVERHAGEIFGQMTTSDIHQMERDPSPAAAWYLQDRPISARGVDLFWDPKLGGWENRTTEGASHITIASRPQFAGAAILVERKALIGLTVTQLADYAIIRALTGANPEKLGNSGAPTILHVLNVPIGGEAPVTMTQWDFAFLRGFYDVRRELRAGAQRGTITDIMTKKLGPGRQ
jgi:hypothetical protein